MILVFDDDHLEGWRNFLSPSAGEHVVLRGAEELGDIERPDNAVFVVDHPGGNRLLDRLCALAARSTKLKIVIASNGTLPPNLPRQIRPSVVRRDVSAREFLTVARLQMLGYTVCPAWDYRDEEMPLSRREWDVLEHIAAGEGNKIIAFRLGLSEHTVRVHVRNILKKLGISNRTQAALWLQRHRAGAAVGASHGPVAA